MRHRQSYRDEMKRMLRALAVIDSARHAAVYAAFIGAKERVKQYTSAKSIWQCRDTKRLNLP